MGNKKRITNFADFTAKGACAIARETMIMIDVRGVSESGNNYDSISSNSEFTTSLVLEFQRSNIDTATELKSTSAERALSVNQPSSVIASAAVASFTLNGVVYSVVQGAQGLYLLAQGAAVALAEATGIVAQAIATGALTLVGLSLGTFLTILLWANPSNAPTGVRPSIPSQTSRDQQAIMREVYKAFPGLKITYGQLSTGVLGIVKVENATGEYTLAQIGDGVFWINPFLQADGSVVSRATGVRYTPDGRKIYPPRNPTPAAAPPAPPPPAAPSLPTRVSTKLPSPRSLINEILQIYRSRGEPDLLVKTIRDVLEGYIEIVAPNDPTGQARLLIQLRTPAGMPVLQDLINQAVARLDPQKLFQKLIDKQDLPVDGENILQEVLSSALNAGLAENSARTGIDWIDRARWLINFRSSANEQTKVVHAFTESTINKFIDEYSVLKGVTPDTGTRVRFYNKILNWLQTESAPAKRGQGFTIKSVWYAVRDAVVGASGQGSSQLGDQLYNDSLLQSGNSNNDRPTFGTYFGLESGGTEPPKKGPDWDKIIKVAVKVGAIIAGGVAFIQGATAIYNNLFTAPKTLENNLNWIKLAERGVITQEQAQRLNALSKTVNEDALNLRAAANPILISIDQEKFRDPATRTEELNRVLKASDDYIAALYKYRSSFSEIQPFYNQAIGSQLYTDQVNQFMSAQIDLYTKVDAELVNIILKKNDYVALLQKLDNDVSALNIAQQSLQTNQQGVANSSLGTIANIDAAIAALNKSDVDLTAQLLAARERVTKADQLVTSLGAGIPTKKEAWVQQQLSNDAAAYAGPEGQQLLSAWNARVLNNGGRTMLPRDAAGRIVSPASDLGRAYILAVQAGRVAGASILELQSGTPEEWARAADVLATNGGVVNLISQVNNSWGNSAVFLNAQTELESARRDAARIKGELADLEAEVARTKESNSVLRQENNQRKEQIRSGIDVANDNTLLASATGRLPIEREPDGTITAGLGGSVGEPLGILNETIELKVRSGQAGEAIAQILSDASLGRVDLFASTNVAANADFSAVGADQNGQAILQIRSDLRGLLSAAVDEEEFFHSNFRIPSDVAPESLFNYVSYYGWEAIGRAGPNDTTGIPSNITERVRRREEMLGRYDLTTTDGIMGALRERIIMEPKFAHVVEAYFKYRGITIPSGEVLPNVGRYGLDQQSAQAVIFGLPESQINLGRIRYLDGGSRRPLTLSPASLAQVGAAFQQFVVIRGANELPTVPVLEYVVPVYPRA